MMDPKRIRLVAIAAGIPIVLVALISFAGGGGGKKDGGPVVVVTNTGGSDGTARPTGTAMGLTLEELLKNPGNAPGTGRAVVTPTLPPANPKEIADLMDKGERSYMSGDLATARGFYDRATRLDPKCERCKQKLELLEKQMLREIQDAFRTGEGYLKDGRWDQAIWSLERVFALDPDPKSQFHENARTLVEQAKQKKAENSR